MNVVFIGFICYLIVILCVGFYSKRLTNSLKDYALGGHRLGPIVIAFSERASGESAWLMLGLPGAALMAGIFEIWTVFGCLVGIIFSWYIIAYPIRKEIEKYNVITLPEYFEKKFNDKNGLIRFLSSVIITFFFTFYVAAQFSGAGKVLNVTFGIAPIHGMILGAFIIIFYTIMGGFLAVAWTDLIQGIIMIATLIILPLIAFIEVSKENFVQLVDWSILYNNKVGFAALTASMSGLSWGLGYLGQPHLIARFMAIDKAENIKISRKIAIIWAVPAFFGAMFIGLIGIKLIESGNLFYEGEFITSVSQISDPEKLMPIMSKNLLPAWLAGIFISGAIAAMMSTADSQLLTTTTIITREIQKKIVKKTNNEQKLLFIGRIITILISSIALYMAWNSNNLVFAMVSYAWGGLGAAFGPALILSLHWKGIKKVGVLAGLISGTLLTIFPIYSNFITPRFSAFALSFIIVIFFSKLKKYY